MRTRFPVVLLLAAVAVAASWPAPIHSQGPAFDLVIRSGRVVDGTGGPWFVADVGIKGDTITAVQPRLNAAGARVIEAQGLVVSPGFVDVHTHVEPREGGEDMVGNPASENNLRQGVTTVIGSPDGGGPVGVGAYLAKVEAARPAINVAAFIGHGSVRSEVMGQVNRAATADELEKMRALVRTGMREGAVGLSTGLFYVPGNYAPLEEVIELARVAGEFGGIHQSHMKDEAAKILDSVRDTIAIGEKGGLPTQVTHHKIVGKANWGRSVDTLRMIDEARARGVDATIDQYPYTASSTSIQGGLIPQWAQEGGREKMLAGLRDQGTRGKVLRAIASSIENDRGGGDPGNVVLAACGWDPSLAGKSLAQVLKERGRAVSVESAAELVIEIVEKGGCSAIYHAINEEDLVRIMRHPATMIASDAAPGVPTFGRNVPHPRAYGTFARVLGLYVREKKVLSLEEAILKMSAFPARRVGLADRGVIRPGMKADVVVFNAATIIDRATFEKPHQYAEGVSAVVVNGQVALADGKVTPARAGRALRRQ